MDRRKIIRRIAILLILVGAAIFIKKWADSKEAKDLSEKSFTIVEKAKSAKEEAEEELLPNQKMFEGLNSLYNSDTIIAYMETGPIKEHIVHAKSVDDYLWTDPSGKENHNGTVALYYMNKSLDDELLLLFGHSMNDGSKFSYLVYDRKEPEEFKNLTLYYPEGERHYRLVKAGSMEESELDRLLWLEKEALGSPDWAETYFDINDKHDGEQYLVLSTCATYGGAYRGIYVYRLVEEKEETREKLEER